MSLKRIVITLVFACGIIAISSPSQAQQLYGVTGRGGTPGATLHLISLTDASVTPVVTLDRKDGQVIAYNPDDGFMYHWTGFQADAIMEKIDLITYQVTGIPVSGFPTREVYSATHDPVSGAFLTTDLNFHLVAVTTGGVRTDIGTTSNWVRGLTFVGDALYGGHNSLIPVNELYTIDPANGDFLSTTPVTLAGYTVAGFAGQATHPRTGELWAVLLVEERPKKDRILVTIQPSTGVATEIGLLPEGSGFSSLAFVPAPIVPVEIDIKPGNEPNVINPGSNGVIPVAIFSTGEFDATMIDPATIVLAGAQVAIRGKGKLLAHVEDVNEDGFLDLICQIETESLSEEIDLGEVCLTGETLAGEQVRGCDFVVIVPNDN